LGAAHVMYWPATPPPLALPASLFARTFLATLRTPGVSVPEAYAIAGRFTRAHCSRIVDGSVASDPVLPKLLYVSSVVSRPLLPSNASIPPPEALQAALNGGQKIEEAVPGYEDVRLLAPNAEMRLLVAGLPAAINPHSLGQLCEGLRGVLAAETRGLTLVGMTPLEAVPVHLPTSASHAVRCDVRTASGYGATVILAGPEAVLAQQPVVEYALRQVL
jgi:hypothetical protein